MQIEIKKLEITLEGLLNVLELNEIVLASFDDFESESTLEISSYL